LFFQVVIICTPKNFYENVWSWSFERGAALGIDWRCTYKLAAITDCMTFFENILEFEF